MSKQRVVKDEIWDDDWFYELDPSEKLVWLFLLTNPRGNVAGIYKLNKKWASQSTGLDFDVFNTILSRFVKDGKILDEENWIALVNFHKHLAYRNASVAQGILRIYKESTGCPQAVYSVWVTLLNSTLLYLSDMVGKMPTDKREPVEKIIKNIKTITMGWNIPNDNDSDLPSIGDDGEVEQTDQEKLKKENEKVRALMEWGEKVRGKSFLDKPTQIKHIKLLKGKGISPTKIKDTFVGLVQSDYWKNSDRLPDFKTVVSTLKNER